MKFYQFFANTVASVRKIHFLSKIRGFLEFIVGRITGSTTHTIFALHFLIEPYLKNDYNFSVCRSETMARLTMRLKP